MKTPDEIKKGLECYITQNTGGCEDIPCRDCPHYDPNSAYTISACKDALAYIQQLERERDAAVERCVNADDVSAGYYQEIKQLEAAQPKWISVEERLPCDRENVLVYIASEKEGVGSVIAITNYTHNMPGFNIEGWVSPWQYCFWDRKVTHWMNLPEPPK